MGVGLCWGGLRLVLKRNLGWENARALCAESRRLSGNLRGPVRAERGIPPILPAIAGPDAAALPLLSSLSEKSF